MIGVRLAGSLIAAFALNGILPAMPEALSSTEAVEPGFSAAFFHWLESSLWLCVKIFGIIISLMIIQRLLEEFGVLKALSRLFAPLMNLFGLTASASFLWILGNTVGLAYGSAIMMDYAKLGKLEKKEADLLNHHLAVSHSQVEDPLLFMVIGLPVWWLIIPRLILAILVVWERKLEWRIKYIYTSRHPEAVSL